MENDATINDRTARAECDKSLLKDCSLASSEDIGETVLRAGQFSGMMNFDAQHSKEPKSDVRHSPNDMMDTEPPKGPAFTPTRPRLVKRTLEKADDEELVLLNHAKGRSHDNLNVIDRLFNGLI